MMIVSVKSAQVSEKSAQSQRKSALVRVEIDQELLPLSVRDRGPQHGSGLFVRGWLRKNAGHRVL